MSGLPGSGSRIGNDDRRSMNRVMGGTLPARLWHDVMMQAHEGRAPTALPGTMPTVPLAQAPPGTAAKSAGQPAVAPIDPDFVERALRNDTGPAAALPPAAPSARSSWVNRATDKIRRWVSGVAG